ncbi:GNAT family N-acetyltransferase [uncultured Roseobacter sp.]|uniref:GNAT family N-acetyltransferase n=1 Tax=uncultured Roseobacter sp. TaxID=114847 RepID=UPI0026086454|nr:GNAT family N-acetyltransferase [uncultured Roseobacter sp.]
MTQSPEIINCAALDEAQLAKLRALSVTQEQAEFGGTFPDSLETILSGVDGSVQGFCFLEKGEPIGMVVLKQAPATADWVPGDAVSLHGFKIDANWQGKGYGRAAFRLAVEAAARSWPEATQLVLAVDAENSAALAVYRSYGMTDSGPVYSGRIGKEHRLSKALR